MPDEGGELVSLYVYDLSGGLARQLSPMLLGKQLDGIWHSSIVVGGSEYYFGFGINQSRPGQSPFGRPAHVYNLGTTHIPREIRDEFLADLGERYTPASYSLLYNNCNNFSNELAQLLVGQSIPDHITGLPQEVISTPFGQMLLPMLQGLERQLGSVRQQATSDPGFDPGFYEDNFYDANPVSQPQAAQQAQQGPADRPESSAAAAARAPRLASAGHSAAAAVSVNAGSNQAATTALQEQQQQQLNDDGAKQPHVAGAEASTGVRAERAGSAVDAAAQQIAAATGLAMVEEAEERLAAAAAADSTAPTANGVGTSPPPAAAAAGSAGAAENGSPAASSADNMPAGQQAANGVDAAAAAAALPAAPPSRQARPPARSAAAAAAAAAAERRARALAGLNGHSPSDGQAALYLDIPAPAAGSSSGPGEIAAPPKANTNAAAAAVAPAEAKLALATAAAAPTDGTAALGRLPRPAAAVLERSRRAAVEEAVREEFVQLVSQGGLSAEEAAATAARDAAQVQGQ